MDPATPLLDTTARVLARHEVHFGTGPVLVAVSGGRDSTVLAWLVAELHRTGRLASPVVFGQVDHGTHERSGDAAIAVGRLAERLGCAFVSARPGPLPAREEAWRDARYAALGDLAKDRGARVVLTAHHADDNLETVLFRMMRGTGPRGLAGIPEIRSLCPDLTVIRPLLDHRVDELHRLLEHLELPFVDDPTNRDLRFTRNRLRHEWIPALRASTGPDLEPDLFELADHARRVTAMVSARAQRILAASVRFETEWRATLCQAGPATPGDAVFLRETLCLIYQRLTRTGRRPRFRWTERVVELLAADCGRRVDGVGGLLVERTRTGLLLLDEARAGTPPTAAVELTADRSQRFGTTEWWITVAPQPTPPLAPSPGFPADTLGQQVVLDPRRAPWPWRLRVRRPGDRFHPLGAPGPVDLRRFLQNRHCPRFDRDRLPLLVDAEDRILWVPGVEIGHRDRVRLDTTDCFAVKLSILGGEGPDDRPY